MKEQSHKNEMSAAIRGDFQRLRARGVAATLAPRDHERVEPDPPDVLLEPIASEPAVDLEPAAPERAGDRRPEVHEPVARPGFVARLLGR